MNDIILMKFKEYMGTKENNESGIVWYISSNSGNSVGNSPHADLKSFYSNSCDSVDIIIFTNIHLMPASFHALTSEPFIRNTF